MISVVEMKLPILVLLIISTLVDIGNAKPRDVNTYTFTELCEILPDGGLLHQAHFKPFYEFPEHVAKVVTLEQR